MQAFTEAELQVLIALAELSDPIETPNNIHYSFHPRTLAAAQVYFRGSLTRWAEAYARLMARGLLAARPDAEAGYALTEDGLREARRMRLERPPIYYWYCDFYHQTAASPANAAFCERVYGRDLCQQGFMDMEQLHKLIEVSAIGPGDRVLDLGCGAGQIAEYISDCTGALVWGMDYIGEAIQLARARTTAKRDRLDFRTGNLDHLDRLGYPPAFFDVLVASDTLYMPNELESTLRQMRDLLAPGGRMAIYYSFDLWDRLQDAPEGLLPENTPLGRALVALALSYQTWDFTQADYRHALLKREVTTELKDAFAAEGNMFLYETRMGEAEGVKAAVEQGIHARYLYLVRC